MLRTVEPLAATTMLDDRLTVKVTHTLAATSGVVRITRLIGIMPIPDIPNIPVVSVQAHPVGAAETAGKTEKPGAGMPDHENVHVRVTGVVIDLPTAIVAGQESEQLPAEPAQASTGAAFAAGAIAIAPSSNIRASRIRGKALDRSFILTMFLSSDYNVLHI